MRNEQSTPPTRVRRRVRRFPAVLIPLALTLGVVFAILSFVDIGGKTVLNKAREILKERTGMDLSATGVRGNPIRGYTFEDISLASAKGEKILSASTLSGQLDFLSLLGGSPRLSVLSVGGIATDLDLFLAAIRNIELPEGGGETEIPINRISLRDSRFTSSWGKVDVDEIGADIRGTNMGIDLEGSVNDVSIRGKADLDVRGAALAVNKADIRFGKGTVVATGDMQPTASSQGATTLNFQGSARGLDLKEIAALWPGFLRTEDYDGTVNLDLEARGTTAAPVLSGTADYKGSKVGGYPMERFGAQLRYAEERLTLNDIQATVLSVPIDGELAIATRPGQSPSVLIKLEGRDAPLDEIGKAVPSLEGMKGRVSAFTANLQGPTNALNGSVHLSAPRIVFRNREVSNLAVQLKVAKSDTAAVNGKYVFEGAQGYLQGTVDSLLNGPRLNLTAKLVELDVTRLADLIPDSGKYGLAGKVSATVNVKGSPSAPTLTGTLQSPSFAAQGHTLINPSVTFAYAKDVLTLQKSGGTLNGMPIQLSGTVRALTSKAPAIDMKAQLSVSPDSLKAYVPDIASYKLKGDIHAGVKLSGKLPAPEISLVASAPSLSALGNVSVKNLELSTALGSDLSKLDTLDLSIKAENAAANGFGLSDLTAAIRKKGSKIDLSSLSARSGSGALSGSGNVTVGGKSPKLDLAFDLDKLELAPLASASGVGLKGALSGQLRIGGTADVPEVAFKGRSPVVVAQGVALSNLTFDLSGTTQALKLNAFGAEVGGAPLSATGTIRTSPSMKADLAIRGEGLDLAALTDNFPDLKGQIKGKADLVFNLTGSEKGSTGTGSFSSSAVEAFGLRLSAVNLPLSLGGDTFKVQNGTLSLYGGKATNSLTFDLKTLKFSDTLTANGIDVNALIQDVTGGLGGKVTGQGSLDMKISGSAGKTVGYTGTGQFTLGSGGISGFKGLDVATRLYGVNAVRYIKVTAPLELQTGRLILKKGAVATAPEGDPLYRYARLAEDGTIKFDKNLYLLVEGNVNFQLINALAGGALGGAGALLQGGAKQLTTGAGLEDILKGALQGGQQGGSSADFRDVTVKIAGKADSPAVSLVKVGSSSRGKEEAKAATASADAQPAETPTPPKSLEEQVVDRVVDAIAPKKQEPSPAQEQARSEDAAPSSGSGTPSLEEQLKEKVGDELKKGLEGLFK